MRGCPSTEQCHLITGNVLIERKRATKCILPDPRRAVAEITEFFLFANREGPSGEETSRTWEAA